MTHDGEARGSSPLPALHILSDLATPHNNALVGAIRASGKLRVITWYANRHLDALPWKEALGGTLDNYYFDSIAMRGKLLLMLLRQPEDHVLLVGYSNMMNRIVLLWCVLVHRRFMMWSDLPQGKKGAALLVRRIAHWLVKRFADPLFVVGKQALNWFEAHGFARARLVNLPIFIELPSTARIASVPRAYIREKYRVAPDTVFAVAASRLTYAKGYDLLISAVARMVPPSRKKFRLVIVGSGPEESKLTEQVRQTQLESSIAFLPWLSLEDYEELIASADIFVHPARFDAFGGGTLFAMAYGIPVIGSDKAGTVIERIVHGVNGLVYPVEDVGLLAQYLTRLGSDPQERASLGAAARETAIKWTPRVGAELFVNAILRTAR